MGEQPSQDSPTQYRPESWGADKEKRNSPSKEYVCLSADWTHTSQLSLESLYR